ncbi:hypothetical protein B4092_0650 [Bacillus licheniformis]|nr:hypothetical protein B4092_0650 [Bacillus licheniformis]TWJ69347.1 hypothetical protein CHCC5020_0167 [Bacillus licheniformis]TWN47990.1 hypothetical protein CHCC14441_3066 [Bacillus licheniformis]TWN53834.1 hypothetical protein CHCC14437_0259 [Bacillus licheniformis]TWO10878.1 hypothetical protein CHCC20486_3776 [Bacillus licheniformis]
MVLSAFTLHLTAAQICEKHLIFPVFCQHLFIDRKPSFFQQMLGDDGESLPVK